MAEQFLVNVYFDPEDEAETAAAKNALLAEHDTFDGCIAGTATRTGLEELKTAHLSFELVERDAAVPRSEARLLEDPSSDTSEFGRLLDSLVGPDFDCTAKSGDRGPATKRACDVVVSRALSREDRLRLSEAGAELSSRSGECSYVVHVAPEQAATVESLSFVERLRNRDENDRIGPSLRRALRAAAGRIAPLFGAPLDTTTQTAGSQTRIKPGTLKRLLSTSAIGMHSAGPAISVLGAATALFVGAVGRVATENAVKGGRKTIQARDVTGALNQLDTGQFQTMSFGESVSFDEPTREAPRPGLPKAHVRRILVDSTPSMRLAGSAVEAVSFAATDFIHQVGRAAAGRAKESGRKKISSEDIAVAVDAPVLIDVVLSSNDEIEEFVSQVERSDDIEISERSGRLLRISAALGSRGLAELARHRGVDRMEQYVAPRLLSDRCREIVGIDSASAAFPGLNGADQIVAILDSGIDATHPDLIDAIGPPRALRSGTANDRIGHGTHVAGIIVGSGAASQGKIRGAAPGARLLSFGIVGEDNAPDLPLDLKELFQPVVDAGVRIINLSWAFSRSGDYSFGSLQTDEFTYANPEVLIVVAAGNDGTAVDGQIRLGTVKTPATAKNALTVGACGTDRVDGIQGTYGAKWSPKFPEPPFRDIPLQGSPEDPVPLSSRGPSGRSVKPDVVAPGAMILSARAAAAPSQAFWGEFENHCYAFNGGTSMAAPVVSGAAAIVRHYLTTEGGAGAPSSALLRAVLIASTVRLDLTGRPAAVRKAIGYPDFDQGFGRIHLGTVLPHPDEPERKLLFDDVANGGGSPRALEARQVQSATRRSHRRYIVHVTGRSRLRLALAWIDRPGQGVQQNMSLEVKGPGIKRNGNHEYMFGRRPSLGGLVQSEVDGSNTVEIVTIDAPELGRYRIYVRATSTPFGPQGYALVVSGDLQEDFDNG